VCCKLESHWCSSCGSEVDSGKTGEYKVLDFDIKLDKGKIRTHKRSIVCKRCLDDPMMKDCLAMLDEVQKLPNPPPPDLKIRPVEGALCCKRCGRVITEEIPHVALTLCWDVNYESLIDEQCAMCKECYSRDRKTQMVWKFLAKLGKNPPFLPRVRCASSYRCATFESGPKGSPFECRHVGITPATIKDKKKKDTVYDTYKLYCERAHPRTWTLPGVRSRKLILPVTGPNTLPGLPANVAGGSSSVQSNNPINAQLSQMLVEFKKCTTRNTEKMEAAAKNCKDPSLKAFLEAQVDAYRTMTGMLGG